MANGWRSEGAIRYRERLVLDARLPPALDIIHFEPPEPFAKRRSHLPNPDTETDSSEAKDDSEQVKHAQSTDPQAST